jgi:hypothetical protein
MKFTTSIFAIGRLCHVCRSSFFIELDFPDEELVNPSYIALDAV